MLNFCTYENRLSHLTGIKVLALSLEKNCTGFRLTIFLPAPLLHFRDWVRHHCKHATVEECTFEATDWNVKPEVLLLMLKREPEAVWIDSDIICTKDPRPLLESIPANTLVIAQDARPDAQEEARTAFFGLPFTRKLDKSINSCFIRVTAYCYHSQLLQAWAALMSSESYRQNQSIPHGERPSYMVSDQDVLEAVLASEAAGNAAQLPIKYLTSGKELVTTIVPEAFSIADRIRCSFAAKPILVHGQGMQPWTAVYWGPGFLGTARWQLSAYLGIIKRYRSFLNEDGAGWMDAKSKLTRFCQAVTFNHPYLQGIPLILLSSFWARVLRIRSSFRARPKQMVTG